MKIPRALSILLPVVLAAGCASRPQGIPTQPAAQVPTLAVKLDCGACEVRPTVPPLIVEGYNAAAVQAGAVVTADRQATMTIKAYEARSDAGRLLAGALAGKEEIKAEISYQDKKYAVEDYYRNAWQGIESLAKKIGEMAFDKLK